MKSVTLTRAEWIEISAALMCKAHLIRLGDYGPSDEDVNTTQWANQLDRIRGKIGPDGKYASMYGVKAVGL